jgi:hypothetical protein
MRSIIYYDKKKLKYLYKKYKDLENPNIIRKRISDHLMREKLNYDEYFIKSYPALIKEVENDIKRMEQLIDREIKLNESLKKNDLIWFKSPSHLVILTNNLNNLRDKKHRLEMRYNYINEVQGGYYV